MSLQTARDVPLHIRSESSLSERRISPAWTLAHFKDRLEPITGIPAGSQRLVLSLGGAQPDVPIEATDEQTTRLETFPLQAYAEIYVHDTRPPAARPALTLSDPAAAHVDKYTMPASTYAALPHTVQAYKRANHLGRFDPSAPSAAAAAAARADEEIDARGVALGARVRLLPADADARRGEVAFVGEVEGLPGVGKWVGVRLDEPVGRNDGSMGGKRYFEAGGEKRGVFVRPERVEVGEWEVLDELGEYMEEM